MKYVHTYVLELGYFAILMVYMCPINTELESVIWVYHYTKSFFTFAYSITFGIKCGNLIFW